jgi:hypothetical protein
MGKIYNLILSLACFIFSATELFAQTNVTPSTRTAVTRYKQDFEVRGIARPDSTLLSKINISKYDYLRQPDVRVEAKDSDNNLILILYSEKEIARMKEASLRHTSGIKTVTDVKYISSPKIEK